MNLESEYNIKMTRIKQKSKSNFAHSIHNIIIIMTFQHSNIMLLFNSYLEKLSPYDSCFRVCVQVNVQNHPLFAAHTRCL